MAPFKMKLFGLLYFVQGMPYGLQSNLLPIYLRTFGLSFTKISLTKLLFFPWSLKILWAPFVDQYGTKWKWLLCSMFGLFLCCLVMSRLIPERDFPAMAFILLLMNFFASIQDIAVDGIAVRLLRSEDIGYGNTIQVVAYKMGSLIAGAGLLTVMDYIGWNMLFIIFCVVYAAAMFFSYFIPEEEDTSETKNSIPVLNPCKILGEILKVPGTVWNLIYVMIYKLGEQGAVSMFPMFLLEHGFSPVELGFWNGIVAMGFSIFGSCFGGILMPKYNVFSLIIILFLLRLGNLSLQTLLLLLFYYESFILKGAAVLSIILQHFLGGLITTLTFSIMMLCTQKADKRIQATHYTFLASAEVLGKVLFSTIAGILVDRIGFPSSFCVFLLLSGLSLLHVLNPPEILSKQHKQ
ncbi:major facilitator superfamily domain-containing protein 3 isoform X1 [Leucoraja erinacea]|uniref:major facilitator superfamily domain-containing protein 3 isoform X1 n=1 Tax=Leucoraja erinaceus TaxID=7782 RepID=UPI002454AE61|nr:major facilitator superfamily domain-containing protein 3 isoform X1 [Leucoraja erinacea]XP_055489054.1 major facilitator superfamily domain-containing protein 3 isoform X1 [Leucoraja erinacea]XP_055489055.1 major facilitator superfamily domain-containing protein 3 isoform X1 [Leucoraja erinacea]